MGSNGRSYVMQKKGLIISCTCPLWRYQALDTVPREMRTCKHLQAFLGRELELARVGQVGGEMTRKTYRRLKKQQDEHRLAEKMKEKEYEQIIAKAKLDKEQGELEREWTAVSAMVDSVITPSKEEEKYQVLDSEQEHEKQVEASSNKSKLKGKGNTYQTPSKNGSAACSLSKERLF
ncbi:hypothetical protein GUITHDRAFT_148373 [Guillardia theta CCMP2712]|uniref:SWIM-type domain-containing protein n=1 Tax=Guillardia theta (strain CCMP2712) TaxID=905079 RepID=L1I990_GUITC|nr:hypothetical protein GUITHDRAFT_148373 [Guillardia theta CCMP2712]EKX32773.1 hypothetical protein GUITHDRAFT_148373 [Guillardia theta CCMP2712]|eukprot:XP_005819753.1 hypothetical protein GUITHDRAFT_148373 [Guillardia theta CCMP2712]